MYKKVYIDGMRFFICLAAFCLAGLFAKLMYVIFDAYMFGVMCLPLCLGFAASFFALLVYFCIFHLKDY